MVPVHGRCRPTAAATIHPAAILGMKPSRSLFLDIRGLRYHVRCWGRDGAPAIFMLHGFNDVSASYQFVVDALRGDWQVFAPDLRGFGLTQWSGRDSYWFPDYMADLDALLGQLQPDSPVNLAGHSMGGNVTAMYSGIRPERVRRLVQLDNYGLRATLPAEAPARYRTWLDQLDAGPRPYRDYASFEELAERMRRENPRLPRERAAFLAPHWGRLNERGRVELRTDPFHRHVNPILFRVEESKACWSRITAPVLSIEAGKTHTRASIGLTDEEIEHRHGFFRNLRVERLPEAGHMIHHECPEQVAGWMEPFFA